MLLTQKKKKKMLLVEANLFLVELSLDLLGHDHIFSVNLHVMAGNALAKPIRCMLLDL